MLWWLLLLLIPIAVHLFNFRKYKTVNFPNIQFLQNVILQTQKLKQLKKYLLLASRLLMLLCLVLAFCIPYFQNNKLTVPQHLLVFLDNSASMQEGFENAKNMAREAIKLSGNKDKISVLTASDKVSTFLTQKEAASYVDAINITQFGGNIAAITQTQKDLKFSGQEQVKTIVISDFQRNFLENFKDSLENTTFIKTEAKNRSNLSIDTCYINTPIALSNQSLEIFYTVTNYGENALVDIPVSLAVAEKLQASAMISLPAKSTKTFSFPFAVNAAGANGKIRIEAADLVFDNEIFFTLPAVKKDISVVVSGNNNKYLAAVFNAEKAFKFNAISKLENLEKHQLVIVNNTALSDDELTALRKYVEQNGGNVLLIPSPTGANDNASFLGLSNWSSLKTEKVKLSGIDFKHPLYSNVYKNIPKNPVEPVLLKYYTITAQGRGEVILKASNNDPILVLNRLGKGAIYQLAMPLDPTWSDFPLVGYLFYPTISNMALGGGNKSTLFGWLNPSAPAALNIGDIKLKGVEQFQLYFGENVFTAELFERGNSTYIAPNEAIKEQGVYQLKNSISDKVLANLAFNINRNESNLSFLTDIKGLAKQLGADFLAGDIANHPYFKAKRGILDTTWKWFVLFALLFVLIEIFLLRFLK